jgi:hypothetical protein
MSTHDNHSSLLPLRMMKEGIDDVSVVTLEHDLNAKIAPVIDPEALHKMFKVAT